jgi:hypothetical protein
MTSSVLAYVILFMAFVTFLSGAFGLLMLVFEEIAKPEHVPFRYYAMVIGLISGGLGLIGIGQALRLLLLIVGKAVIPTRETPTDVWRATGTLSGRGCQSRLTSWQVYSWSPRQSHCP